MAKNQNLSFTQSITDGRSASKFAYSKSAKWAWIGLLICSNFSAFSSALAEPKIISGNAPRVRMKAYGPKDFPLIFTEAWNGMPVGFCGSLGREIIRQAMLVSAREEFGLRTIDSAIGEFVREQKKPEAYPYQMDIRFEPIPNDNDNFLVTCGLTRPTGNGNEWSIIEIKPFTIPRKNRYEALAEKAEELSRTEFVEALQSVGFKKLERQKLSEADTKVPDGHFDSVSQFSFLKQLHAERKEKGESIQNLSGLVRGYANLGSLIDYHWGTSAKGYWARSLIYANRMKALYGSTPYTHAHRSYARAFAGMHLTAIEDANAANDVRGDAAPDWLPLIKAFCEYDPDRLNRVDGPDHELALYLRMKQMDPYFDADAGLGIIEDFIRVNPSCLQCMELICQISGVNLLRQVTEGGADRMWPYIYQRLAETSVLPSAVLTRAKKLAKTAEQMEVAAEHKARVEIISELRRASDKNSKSELSWRALAEILDDASLLQAWRVVHCETYMLGVSSDETIERLTPLVQHHPLASIIKCYSSRQDNVDAAARQLSKTGNPITIEIPTDSFAVHILRTDAELYTTFVNQYRRHLDNIYADLITSGFSQVEELSSVATEKLLEICPYQPRVVGWSITASPSLSKEQIEELKKKYSDNSFVMYTLGQRFLMEGQSEEGRRCLLKSIEISPTHVSASALANDYRNRAEFDQAIATYEKILELPSYGLEHAIANEQIARILMRQGKWQDAYKYGSNSAEAYSANGLLIGAYSAEGVAEWEAAEAFYKAMGERYAMLDKWYYFCVRRNRGDRDGARRYCEFWWKNDPQVDKYDKLWARAITAIVDGKLKEARKLLIDKNKGGGEDVYTRLVASLLADKEDVPGARDDCYEYIESSFNPSSTLPTLVSLFRIALKNEKLEWNSRIFDELIARSSSPSEITFAYYCAGMFLDQHGKQELGREYLVLAATALNFDSLGSVLAGHALTEKQIDVEETRTSDRPESWTPSYIEYTKAVQANREERVEDAIKHYQEATRLRPEFLTPKFDLSFVYFNRDDQATAVKLLEEVVAAEPDFEKARYWLTEIYAGSDRDEMRDGAKALQHAQYSFDRRVVKTWLNYQSLAAAHAELKQFDKSIQYIEEAINLNIESEDLKEQLAAYREGKPYRLSTTENEMNVIEEVDDSE